MVVSWADPPAAHEQHIDRERTWNIKNIEVVLARVNAEGREEFAEPGRPAVRNDPGALESAWVWQAPPGFSLPDNIGHAPQAMTFPAPGGNHFGIVCFPPHSAGKRRFSAGQHDDPNMIASRHAEPSMHATNTLDYDVVVSGRVDPGTC